MGDIGVKVKPKGGSKEQDVKTQVNKVKKAAGKAAKSGDKFLLLDPAIIEYALLSQARQINWQKKCNIFSYCLNIILAVVIFAKQNPPLPKDRFFGSNPDGSFVELVELSKPQVNLNEMRVWAETCVLDALDLSFTKKISTVNKVLQDCFDQKGQIAYTNWLLMGESDQVIEVQNGNSTIKIASDSEYGQIVSKRIAMNASPVSASRLRELNPLIIEGQSVARWKMELPLVVTKYEGTEKRGFARYIAVVEMIRTMDVSKPKGVILSSWTLVRGD